jgi:hypothetical protein
MDYAILLRPHNIHIGIIYGALLRAFLLFLNMDSTFIEKKNVAISLVESLKENIENVSTAQLAVLWYSLSVTRQRNPHC